METSKAGVLAEAMVEIMLRIVNDGGSGIYEIVNTGSRWFLMGFTIDILEPSVSRAAIISPGQ